MRDSLVKLMPWMGGKGQLTEMKRAAIQKADAVRGTKPVPDEIWADNEEMILKLSGLL